MRRLIGVITGSALALSLSQFPEFSQQYEQRLGGAVDELGTIVANFDASAAAFGLTRQEALERYAVNPDAFIADQGRDMGDVVIRYERLSAHLSRLQQAGTVQELVSIAEYYDPEIATRAWESYEPAMPVTLEGIAFAAAGLLGGYGLVGAGTYPFRRRHTRRRT